VGSISEAVRMAREGTPPDMMIEVEVENIEDLEKAVEAGADLVMLDNFSPESVDKAVTMARGRVKLEVSGGIDEGNLADYVRSGNVDYISIGAITHSVKAIDISMDVVIDED
jgi:nicotinate-nucleotide pyrophosphorylase (carboxylating)